MAPGASKTVSIVVSAGTKPDPATTATAAVSSTTRDPDPENNTDSETTAIVR